MHCVAIQSIGLSIKWIPNSQPGKETWNRHFAKLAGCLYHQWVFQARGNGEAHVCGTSAHQYLAMDFGQIFYSTEATTCVWQYLRCCIWVNPRIIQSLLFRLYRELNRRMEGVKGWPLGGQDGKRIPRELGVDTWNKGGLTQIQHCRGGQMKLGEKTPKKAGHWYDIDGYWWDGSMVKMSPQLSWRGSK